MTSAAATVETSAETTPTTKHSLANSVLLHLAPGAVLAAAYVALAPSGLALGWPPVLVLSLLSLALLAPLELGHLLRLARRETGRWTLRTVVAFPRPMKLWRFGALVAAVLAATIVLYALAQPADRWFARHVMGFLPPWFDYGRPGLYRGLAPSLAIATLAARFVADVVALPAIEELYFRGYLLPRIPAPPALAPFVSGALFAVYHFWQPYNWPSIFCFSLPMIFAVAWLKEVRVSIATHAALNLLGFVAFAAAIWPH